MSTLTLEMVDAMLSAGLTREQMAALMKASLLEEEARAQERKDRAAAKKRRQRARVSPCVPGTDGDNGGQEGTMGDTPPSPQPPAAFPPDPLSTTPLNPPSTSEKGVRPRATKRPLPDDFPSDRLVAWALQNHPHIDTDGQFRRAKDWALKEGARYADWDAFGRNWIDRAAERTPRNPSRGTGHEPGNRFRQAFDDLNASIAAARERDHRDDRDDGAGPVLSVASRRGM